MKANVIFYALAMAASMLSFAQRSEASPCSEQTIRFELLQATQQEQNMADGYVFFECYSDPMYNSCYSNLGGPSDIIVSRINQKFWPNVEVPHVTARSMAGRNIPSLVSLIQRQLGCR